MNQNSFDLIPHVVINPSTIVTYSEVIWNKPHSRQSLPESFIKSKRTSQGQVSNIAHRKITKAVEYLTTVAHQKKVYEKVTMKYITFKVAFVTLTLPSQQIHDDKTILNTCLNSLLNEIRQYYYVKNYIWRAETQYNGNIHFHLIIDQYIPWYELRNRWNRIINKLGYVDRFYEKFAHYTPNSIDIHSTRKIKNLKNYLSKYMGKNATHTYKGRPLEGPERSMTGRLWGCNYELSNCRGFNTEVDSEIASELTKILSDSKIRKHESVYFTVYYVDYKTFRKVGSNLLFKYFSDYLFEKLGFSEQLTF